ncbi:MAG TPA: heme-binding protein, partial [Dissulfurispiraceae bacterium]|nr:heme-binding protein [Dissulfurispiraceae bacterium]
MNRLLKGLSVSVCLLMILVSAIPAGAQVLNEKQISLALAAEAAVAAMQDCIARGFSVSVAVVDRSGITKLIIRDDGAGPGTPDGSRRKALTAVTFRSSTLLLSQRIAADPT